jgi:hypothetical protein
MMGRIRPLTAGDVPAIAALFHRVFRHSDRQPPAGLVEYLRHLYLEAAACAEDIPSLVHEGDDGGISGFIGRHVLPMRLGDRPLRAALLSTIMADERAGDPLAAAKILKAALNGPQDFSFSETASEVSLRMWKHAGAVALPGHSMEWFRIIRPATSAVEASARRYPVLRALSPVSSCVDDVFRRRIVAERPRWLGLPKAQSGRAGLSVRKIDATEFAGLFRLMTERFPLRPDWSAEALDTTLREAMEKPLFGRPVLAAAIDRGGRPIGGFFYHLGPHGTARATQLLAAPGKEEAVLDALITHAAEAGASAVRGRTQPFLMGAMLGRRIGFLNSASTVLHCRDPEITAAIHKGDAFLNGLAGEQWSRLIGDFG